MAILYHFYASLCEFSLIIRSVHEIPDLNFGNALDKINYFMACLILLLTISWFYDRIQSLFVAIRGTFVCRTKPANGSIVG
jgi:hypothetical protein